MRRKSESETGFYRLKLVRTRVCGMEQQKIDLLKDAEQLCCNTKCNVLVNCNLNEDEWPYLNAEHVEEYAENTEYAQCVETVKTVIPCTRPKRTNVARSSLDFSAKASVKIHVEPIPLPKSAPKSGFERCTSSLRALGSFSCLPVSLIANVSSHLSISALLVIFPRISRAFRHMTRRSQSCTFTCVTYTCQTSLRMTRQLFVSLEC